MKIMKECPKDCRYIYGGDWCICNTVCPHLPPQIIKCPKCGALVKVDLRTVVYPNLRNWRCPECGETGTIANVRSCLIRVENEEIWHQVKDADSRKRATFRGKRVDNNEWIYGYYALVASDKGLKPAIYTEADDGSLLAFEVIPDTVSQSTFLIDRNGKEIYEGDVIVFNKGTDMESYPALIRYNPRRMSFERYAFGELNYLHDGLSFERDVMDVVSVVGNFWDNPEFLDVGKWVEKYPELARKCMNGWLKKHPELAIDNKKKKKAEKVEQESFL